MNRQWLGYTLGAALLVASGCDRKEEARPTAAGAAAASAGLPVPEDYEGTAAKAVTADTLDSRLDALEKEIAATPR